MSTAELAGGFAPPTATLSGIHDHYLRHVQALPKPTQRLMLLAAADHRGRHPGLACGPHPGRRRPEAAAAASEQLLEIGARVRFRHPLVRSAAYAAGSPQDRSSVHRALAEATDGHADPEHRVWHLAAAATGPDEDVAVQLERTADRAQARAGLAGAAAFLQRSVALTAAPERRADRALAAAYANLQAGSFDAASACWPRPTPPPSTNCSALAWSSSGDRSPASRTTGGRCRSACCGLRSGLSHSIFDSPGTRISTRCSRPWSPVGWLNPAAGSSRSRGQHDRSRRPSTLPFPVICCWTAWRR